MKNIDIVRENIDKIQKNGDLYDVIISKENLSLKNYNLIKGNIFWFSRILYGATLIYDKIKSHFINIDEIKEAQDKIREVVGVNIDIVIPKQDNMFTMNNKSKKRKKIAIFYKVENIDIQKYISNLKKIANFCSTYNIKNIILGEKEILNFLCDEDIKNRKKIDISILLEIKTKENHKEEKILVLTKEELYDIIQKLEAVEIEKDFLRKIANEIKDPIIKKVVEEFNKNNDLNKLKKIVVSRLELYLNSKGIYKDKEVGKVIEIVTVKEQYVKVLTKDTKGNTISSFILSLYNYLEVSNYKNLLEKRNKKCDNKEIMQIATLYLYLCNKIKKENFQENSESFYDRIYLDYKGNKQNPYMRSKSWSLLLNLKRMVIMAYCTHAIIFCIKTSIEHLDSTLEENDKVTFIKKAYDKVVTIYQNAFDLEWDILDAIKNLLKRKNWSETILLETEENSLIYDENTNSYTGDKKSTETNYNTIATIYPLCNDKELLPEYYAVGYSKESYYEKGKMNYKITTPLISFADLKDKEEVETLFEISYEISKDDLKKIVEEDHINLLQTLYPIGKDYLMIDIKIIDVENYNQCIYINHNRASDIGNKIFPPEKEVLLQMKKPKIKCTYGLKKEEEIVYEDKIHFYEGETNKGMFVEALKKASPDIKDSKKKIKDAIKEGLKLEKDASLEEILDAIQNKHYSKTPIKDANLSKDMKKMNEEEYFKAVASLDSLICNLSASLVNESDKNLMYITGYKGNSFLLTEEDAHAWNMNPNGTIIDVTPKGNLEQGEETKENIEESIITWGIKNHIHIYTIIILILFVLNKKYGKEITITIKSHKIKKLLETEEIEKAYVKINEILYGGTNIPRKKTVYEWLDSIQKEFTNLEKEKLKELKRELKTYTNEKETIEKAIKLVNEIPYISENNKEIQKKLSSKKRIV